MSTSENSSPKLSPGSVIVLKPILALVLLIITACTYGPPKEQASIENVAVRPGTYQFAIAVRYSLFEMPTGINSFPNGGITQYLEQAALIYLVDAATHKIRKIARIKVPDQLQTSFGIHLSGWQKGKLFLQLSGCPETECYGELTQVQFYELEPEGGLVRISALPEDLDRPPGMLARAPGEDVYMRVSTGSKIISLRTEESAPFVESYQINNTGVLESLLPLRSKTKQSP